ncbi:hypothetical protein [Streptomyces sp. NRRL S-1813]|uniref:hypothetical protein n=1 Tax=Streptomyces sp. NRRL S-1813 TaxID=1463888 RepID=UPI0004C6DE3D|nr:hypothetical protein [Streptomyces sp. NRRL S-1813]
MLGEAVAGREQRGSKLLAGIGLVLIAGQLYSMTDTKAPSSGLDKIAGLPGMLIATMVPAPR